MSNPINPSRSPIDSQSAPSTAEMMKAYTGATPPEDQEEGALAWSYLMVVAAIFLALLFLAWSCQGSDDELVGGLGTTESTEAATPAQTPEPTLEETPTTSADSDTTVTTVDDGAVSEAELSTLQEEVDALLASTQILFDPNEATISEGESVIAEVAALIEGKDVAIKVDGHTDSVGEEDENLALSEDRAATVRDQLVAQGVPASVITTEGFGESEAVQEDPTDAQKLADRRIDISVSLA